MASPERAPEHLLCLSYQGSCSVGISLDHRSTKTGAPDDERSLTVRRLAELTQQVLREGTSVEEAAALMGKEFHLPGTIASEYRHLGKSGRAVLSACFPRKRRQMFGFPEGYQITRLMRIGVHYISITPYALPRCASMVHKSLAHINLS